MERRKHFEAKLETKTEERIKASGKEYKKREADDREHICVRGVGSAKSGNQAWFGEYQEGGSGLLRGDEKD